MLLKGKVALVTGAGRGIGKAIACAFAEQGASLILTARSEEVEAVAASIQSAGGAALSVRGDIASETTVKECISLCRKTYSRLDILVNNAAAMPQAVIGMIAVTAARELFDLNVVAPINLTQMAVRLMRPGASVINISSIARDGQVGASVYSATKGALCSFTLAAAKELGPKGIRVNAIAPGIINTDLIANLTPAQKEKTVASVSLGRVGDPADVAGAAVFLASDLACYVTGQILGVDGGMLA